MSAADSVISSIQHYQTSIKKYHGNSARIQHCINKLYHLPVTVQHLQETGVGKTINSLRKSDGAVGEAARALVAKWKQMVEEESENEQDSLKDDNPHKSYSGGEDSKHRREKLHRVDKSKSRDLPSSFEQKEHSRVGPGESLKRKREPENDQLKKNRRRSEESNGLGSDFAVSLSSVKQNGNGSYEDDCCDGGWGDDSPTNVKVTNRGGSDIRYSHVNSSRTLGDGKNILSSEDEFQTGEFPTEAKDSWSLKQDDVSNREGEKGSKRDKHSSTKHKGKSSSSSSERNKHSTSSKSDQRDSKSSSNRHKNDKSSSAASVIKIDNRNATEKIEDNQRNKDKDKKSKHKDKHRSKDEKKSKSKKKEKSKEDDDGVDSFSGKSFGEALGMMFAPDKTRKKISSGTLSSSPSTSKSFKSSSCGSEKKSQNKDFLDSPSDMEHTLTPLEPTMEVDEDFGLPTLNPNYKPLPQPNFYNSLPKRCQNDEDDLSNIMYSKVQRTKVFSGNRTGYTSVPSLFDLCTRVLQENIDALEYTGGVPFDLLKPVLERANPDQLFTLEHYNAYLIEDTDILWEFHCKKDFRGKKREEMETWREMYMRCREERENKLKSLTANIVASSKKQLPVRKTQLAYVEGTAKPPRNIARKQAKFGTAQASAWSSSSKEESSGPSGLSTSFTGRSTSSSSLNPAVSVPAPRGAGGHTNYSSCKPKHKAPLMQKALQLIKSNRYRR